jgi:hypothetical protein
MSQTSLEISSFLSLTIFIKRLVLDCTLALHPKCNRRNEGQGIIRKLTCTLPLAVVRLISISFELYYSIYIRVYFRLYFDKLYFYRTTGAERSTIAVLEDIRKPAIFAYLLSM